MYEKNILNKIKVKCIYNNCLDEYSGLIAIIIGAIGYLVQFLYSEKSMNMESFSIIALFFFVISELLFLIQGIQKGSPTIAFTRLITTLGFSSFIFLWFISKKKNKKNNKD